MSAFGKNTGISTRAHVSSIDFGAAMSIGKISSPACCGQRQTGEDRASLARAHVVEQSVLAGELYCRRSGRLVRVQPVERRILGVQLDAFDEQLTQFEQSRLLGARVGRPTGERRFDDQAAAKLGAQGEAGGPRQRHRPDPILGVPLRAGDGFDAVLQSVVRPHGDAVRMERAEIDLRLGWCFDCRHRVPP